MDIDLEKLKEQRFEDFYGCCDGYSFDDAEFDGICPKCGRYTCGGEAERCRYSPTECEECGGGSCDGSC